MLGKTAGGLMWMFRYLERSENLARLVETGQRIALTRPDRATLMKCPSTDFMPISTKASEPGRPTVKNHWRSVRSTR